MGSDRKGGVCSGRRAPTVNDGGGIRRRRYEDVDRCYELVESALMKRLVVVLLAVGLWGMLGIVYWKFGEEAHGTWFVGAVFLLALFFLGILTHPANRRSWPTLLANQHSVFLIAPRSSGESLEIPWRYVQSAKSGQYATNVRGVEFSIRKAGLTEEDEQELWRLSSVTDAGDRLSRCRRACATGPG